MISYLYIVLHLIAVCAFSTLKKLKKQVTEFNVSALCKKTLATLDMWTWFWFFEEGLLKPICVSLSSPQNKSFLIANSPHEFLVLESLESDNSGMSQIFLVFAGLIFFSAPVVVFFCLFLFLFFFFWMIEALFGLHVLTELCPQKIELSSWVTRMWRHFHVYMLN